MMSEHRPSFSEFIGRLFSIFGDSITGLAKELLRQFIVEAPLRLLLDEIVN